MKIKKVEILGKTFTVEEWKTAPGDVAMGRSNIKEQRIWIDSSMTKEAQKSVLIHECLHMIAELTHLDLSEGVIVCLETALYSMGFEVCVTEYIEKK